MRLFCTFSDCTCISNVPLSFLSLSYFLVYFVWSFLDQSSQRLICHHFCEGKGRGNIRCLSCVNVPIVKTVVPFSKTSKAETEFFCRRNASFGSMWPRMNRINLSVSLKLHRFRGGYASWHIFPKTWRSDICRNDRWEFHFVLSSWSLGGSFLEWLYDFKDSELNIVQQWGNRGILKAETLKQRRASRNPRANFRSWDARILSMVITILTKANQSIVQTNIHKFTKTP